MNEVELLSLFEVPEVEDAMMAALRVMPKGAHVIAKRGPLGASGLRGGSMIHVPAPTVKAVDTIGAGDVFNAGYLAAIARGESFAACHRRRRGDRVARDLDPSTGICRAAGAQAEPTG